MIHTNKSIILNTHLYIDTINCHKEHNTINRPEQHYIINLTNQLTTLSKNV